MTVTSRLYHWSPSDRYESIRQHGLKPNQDQTVASGKLHYICASADPQRAWILSGATHWCTEIEQWDLWVIDVATSDEIHVRPYFGRYPEEFKIRNPVGADRLWWAGRRDIACVPTSTLERAS